MKANKIDFWSRPIPIILSPDSTQIRESLTNALTWPSPGLCSIIMSQHSWILNGERKVTWSHKTGRWVGEMWEMCDCVWRLYYHSQGTRKGKTEEFGASWFVIVQIIRWLRLRWRGDLAMISVSRLLHITQLIEGETGKRVYPHIFSEVHSSALSVRNR